jgi:hypothetical protein
MSTLGSLDPEPGVGAVVRDCDGRLWLRGEFAWNPLDDGGDFDNDDPESWTKVAGNFGPVTLLRAAS